MAFHAPIITKQEVSILLFSNAHDKMARLMVSMFYLQQVIILYSVTSLMLNLIVYPGDKSVLGLTTLAVT